MILASLVAASLAEGSQRPRARTQELQGRLGLRERKESLTGAAGRWAHARRQHSLHLYDKEVRGRSYNPVADLLEIGGFDLDDQNPDASDKMIPWFAREWVLISVKNQEDRIDSGFFHDGVLPAIRDYVVANPDVDLYAMSLREAEEAADEWHANFAQQRVIGAAKRTGMVVARWPDGCTLQRLSTGKAVEEEGKHLGHCVGGYWKKVRQDKTMIFSYRDPDNVPLITMEIEVGRRLTEPLVLAYDVAMREGGTPNSIDRAVSRMVSRVGGFFSVAQVKGPENANPSKSEDRELRLGSQRIRSWIIEHLRMPRAIKTSAAADLDLGPTSTEELLDALGTELHLRGSGVNPRTISKLLSPIISPPIFLGQTYSTEVDGRVVYYMPVKRSTRLIWHAVEIGVIATFMDETDVEQGIQPLISAADKDHIRADATRHGDLIEALRDGFVSVGSPYNEQTRPEYVMPPREALRPHDEL